MPQVTITHPDGSTDTVPYTLGWEQQTELNKMRRLLIDVNREELDGVTLQPKRDEVELDGVDTVQLTDTRTGSSAHTLVCYSAEWLDTREPFLGGGTLRTGTDQALVQGLIGDVAAWSEGSVSQFATDLSFVFNHSAIGGALRTIERNVPGEIQFRDFGTVDYVDSLGSDKTGSVTLSAAAGTIEESIQITSRGRELDGTHIRVLGAHEGEAQIFANLVPQGDPETYENEVRYSTPRWSDASDTDWTRWPNKDVTDQETAYTEAEAIADEIDTKHVEVETVVPVSVGLEVGDWVRVVKQRTDEDGNVIDTVLDRDMRVHRRTRAAGGRNDADGSASVVDKVLLSTRTTVRRDDDDDKVTRTQFETGFQGNSVVIQGGGSRQPVNANNNAQIPFDYPNIVYENEATLHVRGLPYRAYSSGAASGGTTTSDSSETGEHLNSTKQIFPEGTTVSPTPSDPSGVFARVPPSPTGTLNQAIISAQVLNQTGSSQSNDYEVRNTTTGTVIDTGTISTSDGGQQTRDIEASTVSAGDRIQFSITSGDVGTTTGVENLGQLTLWLNSGSTHTHSIDPHTHPVDPGIIETADTPSNVDVLVGGSTVATNIGSGEFQTQVDLTGELTRDAWNLIELTSDSLGHLQATLSVRGYEQIGTS